MVLSLPMGKTGLNAVYGYAPNWIMGGYILFFIGCNVVMEMLSSSNEVRMEKNGISSVADRCKSVKISQMALNLTNGKHYSHFSFGTKAASFYCRPEWYGSFPFEWASRRISVSASNGEFNVSRPIAPRAYCSTCLAFTFFHFSLTIHYSNF